MKKAVLFDLDGVLVDSERADQQINVQFLAERGYVTDPRVFWLWIGTNPKMNTTEEIKKRLDPADGDPDRFIEEIKEYRKPRRGTCNFGDYVFPDTKEALRQLKEKGLLLACCSSSTREYIDKALRECGVTEYFDYVISGRELEFSKPNPDIYLKTMKHFGLTANECLVIEDSPTGIEAGHNAGMKVLARRDHTFGLDQSQADHIIEALTEIINYLD